MVAEPSPCSASVARPIILMEPELSNQLIDWLLALLAVYGNLSLNVHMYH